MGTRGEIVVPHEMRQKYDAELYKIRDAGGKIELIPVEVSEIGG